MPPTSKFADLVSLSAQPRPPVTPREAARGAQQALQTSLFSRLRKAKGGALAGRLAWMLVRAGTPSHPDCAAALAALASFPITDLRMFAIACEGARDSLGGAGAARAGEVLAAIEGVVNSVEIGRVAG